MSNRNTWTYIWAIFIQELSLELRQLQVNWEKWVRTLTEPCYCCIISKCKHYYGNQSFMLLDVFLE